MIVLSPPSNRRIRKVADLLDDQGNWKEGMVRKYFLPIDIEVILKIKPSRRLDEDVLAWQPEKSGVFSVRSAYKLAFNQDPEQCMFASQSMQSDGSNLCWRRIWNAKVPPKVQTFAWKVASNALSTEMNKRP
jgi:hypothetical protein